MSTIRIADLPRHVGEEVTLQGWLFNKRSSGKLHFLEVRDGSATVQVVVFKGDVTPELFEMADHIQAESTVEVTGMVKKHSKLEGVYELQAKDVKLLASVTQEYPISAKKLAGDVFGTDAIRVNILIGAHLPTDCSDETRVVHTGPGHARACR